MCGARRGGRAGVYNAVQALANVGGHVLEEQMETIHGLAELEATAAKETGPTEWFTIDQARVDGFADDTEDHQWIHVDTERAAAGPFGGPVARWPPDAMADPVPRRRPLELPDADELAAGSGAC